MTLASARRTLVALVLLLTCALLPGHALADGDPGSDVLLLQNLFVDDTFPAAPQLQLGALLNATAAVGQPVRVAVIRQSDDLGTVTPLWRKPQTYAAYLGLELSNTYTGRLLVVMPNGFGVYWSAHRSGAAGIARALSSVSVSGDSPSALVAATKVAVYRIEAAAGVSAATLDRHRSAAAPAAASGSGPVATSPGVSGGSVQVTTSPVSGGQSATPPPATSTHSHADLLVIVVVVLLLVVYVAFLRGWRPKIRLRRPFSSGGLKGVRVKPVALLPAGLLLIVAVALVVNQSGSSGPATVAGGTLASNPNLEQGTSVYTESGALKAAPVFKLTDETGKPVSLRQYRGKVVILGFVDAECQTICPLTTAAMLDAKRSLGPAGKDVQLLGVDVNWKSTQIEDVLNYTELHGLTGQWHFLTGSIGQLERVWNAYGVNEKSVTDPGSNDIDHVAALYVIDPQGRIRTTYVTDSSYAAIPQLGQLLARDASRLLPSPHPRVSSHYSYAEVKGITPAQTVSLPRSGGGTVTLGPGRARLYLFFATWDKQTTAIAAELSELNAYQRAARADGLPPLTAVDEGSVEPSTQALPAFLRTLQQPLQYPVAIDNSGKVADGYEVEGAPWFVLTSPTGQLPWVQEVYTAGWPSLTGLEKEVKAALSKAPVVPTSEAAAQRELVGSPAPLAALHTQASRLLSGGPLGFYGRIRRLHGYPVVVNIWASWCTPCQAEFHLFSNASAIYGKHVAFLGADTDSQTLTGDARAFLQSHEVSYPSYQLQTTDLNPLLAAGLEGTPTTVYLSPGGKVIYVHVGQYLSQGALDLDIEDYALGGAN
jgi:cytochrome oxidase Cu insertion factor (SCO1/SenC/PrrC family)/thiol-disulfide isomerase/thioredoxin